MEEHFLNKYVKGKKGFQAEPWYNPLGDCIEYQTINEAVVADRIDERLTIYRSVDVDKPVGFKIKDIKALLLKYGCDGLAVRIEQKGATLISVAALLLAAYEDGPLTIERRRAYANALLPQEAGFNIPVDQLCATRHYQSIS